MLSVFREPWINMKKAMARKENSLKNENSFYGRCLGRLFVLAASR
jgi:hypothetical protein